MSRFLPLISILLALVCAPLARAATWAAPATVSAPHTFIGRLSLVGSSSLVAAWTYQDGVGTGSTGGAAAAGRPPAAAFGPEHPAPADVLDVAAYGSTRTIALSQALVKQAAPQRFAVRVALGRTDGSFSPSRTLVTAETVYLPQLAVAADGRALVAYIQQTAAGRRIVNVLERAPAGSFGAPHTLSGAGQADTVSAAVGAHGDEVVAFARNGRVLARVRRAGHSWGPIRELAVAHGGTQWALSTAISPAGRVEVVWRRHQVSRSGVPGIRSIEAAYVPAGRSVFSPPQTMEADGAGLPRLIETAGGFAIAYTHDPTSDTAGPASARVAQTVAGSARFGPAVDAVAPVGGLRDVTLSSSPSVGLVAAWVRPLPGGDGDGRVEAAVLSPGASAFGPVEAVSPDENADTVELATDPGSGEPVALWSARPGGTGPGVPIADIHSVVRWSTRLEG